MRPSLMWMAAAVFFAATNAALAERVSEDRETADYVFTGKVKKVYERQQGRLHEYVVAIYVDKVERGDVKPQEFFYASCFQRTRPLFPTPEASGHDEVPKEGQVIKAYVRHAKGSYEGNYPDWFEVIEEE